MEGTSTNTNNNLNTNNIHDEEVQSIYNEFDMGKYIFDTYMK